MSQPLNYLDEVKKQTGELLKQIEAYKSSRELNEGSARALEALCLALENTVRNLKPFSDDVFEKIADSTEELQLVISSQEEKLTSLHTVVEEVRGSNLEALQSIEENMKESQENSRISIGKALTDLESVTQSGLVDFEKNSTHAQSAMSKKISDSLSSVTKELKPLATLKTHVKVQEEKLADLNRDLANLHSLVSRDLSSLDRKIQSGQDSLQGALITEIKKSTKAIETATTKLNKATEEATADLKAHVDGACRLILDGHETVKNAIAEQEEKNSGRAKFQGVLLLIIAGILIYRLYLEVLSS